MVIYLVKYCTLSELGNISQVAYRTQVLEERFKSRFVIAHIQHGVIEFS